MIRLAVAIQRIWWKRQRQIDIDILWPACKRCAPTLEDAHKIFMVHAVTQPCWMREYGDKLWHVIQSLA